MNNPRVYSISTRTTTSPTPKRLLPVLKNQLLEDKSCNGGCGGCPNFQSCQGSASKEKEAANSSKSSPLNRIENAKLDQVSSQELNLITTALNSLSMQQIEPVVKQEFRAQTRSAVVRNDLIGVLGEAKPTETQLNQKDSKEVIDTAYQSQVVGIVVNEISLANPISNDPIQVGAIPIIGDEIVVDGRKSNLSLHSSKIKLDKKEMNQSRIFEEESLVKIAGVANFRNPVVSSKKNTAVLISRSNAKLKSSATSLLQSSKSITPAPIIQKPQKLQAPQTPKRVAYQIRSSKPLQKKTTISLIELKTILTKIRQARETRKQPNENKSQGETHKVAKMTDKTKVSTKKDQNGEKTKKVNKAEYEVVVAGQKSIKSKKEKKKIDSSILLSLLGVIGSKLAKKKKMKQIDRKTSEIVSGSKISLSC